MNATTTKTASATSAESIARASYQAYVDKDRGIRRQKQKRAKEMKRLARQQYKAPGDEAKAAKPASSKA